MPRSSRQQPVTAGIAILAVLLLFVAPMISKNLAQHHASRPVAAEMSGMPMMHHHDAMAMAGHEMTMADHGMMNDSGFACGYCDLLVHVPLMLWVFVPFIWWQCLISRAPPPPASRPLQCRRWRRLHRPRAPPSDFTLTVY